MALIQCPECANEVSEDAEVCPNCGYILRKKHSIIGIIGFILSIASWFCGIYLTLIVAAIALVLCIIGCLQKNKKHVFPIIGNVISFLTILIMIFSYSMLYKSLMAG